jgi:hypothetical protein
VHLIDTVELALGSAAGSRWRSASGHERGVHVVAGVVEEELLGHAGDLEELPDGTWRADDGQCALILCEQPTRVQHREQTAAVQELDVGEIDDERGDGRLDRRLERLLQWRYRGDVDIAADDETRSDYPVAGPTPPPVNRAAFPPPGGSLAPCARGNAV